MSDDWKWRGSPHDGQLLVGYKDEDKFHNDTAEVIIELEKALEEKLGSTKWEWEWRSVIGEDYREDPIWSLHLFVETKREEYD
jgi:hypothetical protein